MHGHDGDEPLVRRMRETARAGDMERQRALDEKLDDFAKRAMEPRADDKAAPVEHILQFFAFAHLPPHLQAVSRPFGEMADRIVAELPRNPERTVALRKLLESKDAAVRALVAK
jgi:hypothetical protein